MQSDTLWEEVASLLTKGAMEIVQLLQDQEGRGGAIPIASWLWSTLVGSAPSSTSVDLTCTPPCLNVPYGDPQLYCSGPSPGLVEGVVGSQGCLFACADSSVPLILGPDGVPLPNLHGLGLAAYICNVVRRYKSDKSYGMNIWKWYLPGSR